MNENTANEWAKWKTDNIINKIPPLLHRYLATKNRNREYEVTKWGRNQQEEICCHKRETVMMSFSNKYYYTMKSQYNNISMLKLKQMRKTSISECDVVWNHSMIDCCQVMTAMKWSLARSPKMQKWGTNNEKNEQTELLSMILNIARLCCKSIRRSFHTDYLSIGQWATIDNKEWWGSRTTNMFNTTFSHRNHVD